MGAWEQVDGDRIMASKTGGFSGSHRQGAIGVTIADVTPENLRQKDKEGCRWASNCVDCPQDECTYDEAHEAKRRRQ